MMAAQADLGAARGRLAACGADPAIVGVCESCLAPAQDARPRDAGAVAARVAEYLASEEERTRAAQLASVESRAAAARARIEADAARARTSHSRRQRRMTAAVAAALLVTLAVAGVAWAWRDRDRTERAGEASRDVEAAIAQSVFLRGRAVGRADAAAAHDALDAAQRADRLASARDVGEDVRRKASRSLEETQAESVRARKLATLLLRVTRVKYRWGSGFPGTGVDTTETLRKAIALVPGCAEAHRRLAQDLGAHIEGTDDWRDYITEMEAEFRKAVELDPESVDARVSLIDFIRGDAPESDELAVHEEALIRLDPLQPAWRVMSFERNVRNGSFDEAERIAREIADLDPDEAPLGPRVDSVRDAVKAADGVLRGERVPEAWKSKPWDLVEACLFARRYATIARLWKTPGLGLETNEAPMTGLAALRVAALRAGLGEGTDARDASDEDRARFRRLSLDGYRSLLAGVAGTPAAADEGRPWSAQALSREKEGGSWPDSPGGMLRADLMARLPAEEREAWRDAFLAYDRFGRQSFTYNMMWAFIVGGGPSGDMTDDVESSLRRHPDDQNLQNMLGVAQYRSGAFEKAIETLKRVDAAYSASPNGSRPSTLAYLAMALAKRGRADEAQRVLERCRTVTAQPRYAQNPEALGYLFRAESVVEGDDRDSDTGADGGK
jgi:tetratricopeptide (TPR) repeat protein